jgi:hypothetical protein
MQRVPFEAENVSGWIEDGRIHIYGSGRLLSPLQANDWLRTNFAIWPVWGIHFGYLVAALRVFRLLRSHFRDEVIVVVTGHSLGGSVAEVLAVLIAAFTPAWAEFHNYGGPGPWARGPFSRLAQRRLRRKGVLLRSFWYSVGIDPVPHVMFWNRHMGEHEHVRSRDLNFIRVHTRGYEHLIEEGRA